ncbi:MAG TPA: histidinol-phosphate transaminase [Polyangia bacterium]|nr:histidinol-phosphate transaminase [Polyangia bacterium]
MPVGKTDPARALSLVRPAIRAMRGYAPGEQIPDAVKLNTNEGAYPPSPRVMAVLAGVAEDTVRLYPDPVARRLREAAAARFAVAPEQILAGNGSDDCLTILYRTFLDEGDRVACPWPTYGLYEQLAAIQGAKLVTVPFRQSGSHAGARWELPPELGAQRAKLLILANPNNPSATLVPVDELRKLADAAAKSIVVVDEAYVDFALADGIDASILPYLDEHPNVVVLRTFSKSYSLAGARLGLLFASAPLVEEMMKVKDSYNVNALTQALGTAALEDRATHDAAMRGTLDERARLERELGALGFSWPESRANFLLVDFGARAEALYAALKAEKLLVRWWPAADLRTKLRISVGRPDQNNRLLAALRRLHGPDDP